MVYCNHQQQSCSQEIRKLPHTAGRRPDRCRGRGHHAGKKDGVRPAQKIEERDYGQASQRAASQIRAVQTGDMGRLAGEHNRKLQPSDAERNG